MRSVAIALAFGVLAVATTPVAWADDGPAGGRNPAAKPQVVVVSLDGAQPDVVEHYLKIGVLDKRTGLAMGMAVRKGAGTIDSIGRVP